MMNQNHNLANVIIQFGNGITALLLLSIGFLLSSCASPEWDVEPSAANTRISLCASKTGQLNNTSVLFNPAAGSTPVTTLAFDDSELLLYALQAGTPGTLTTWETSVSTTLKQNVALQSVGRRGAQFSISGDRLAVSAGRTPSERYLSKATAVDFYGTNLVGVQVWDLQTGNLLGHLWNNPESQPRPVVRADAAVSADGSLTLAAAVFGYELVETETGKGRCVGATLIDNLSDQTTTAVAFAPTNDTFVVGGNFGYMRVYRGEDERGTCAEISGLRMGHDETALAISFHPTNKRYAVLTNRSIWVANVEPSLFHPSQRISRSESSLGGIQFSQDGQWLAIATATGIQLLSYPSLGIVTSDSSYRATTVAFSPHKCSVAVGDSEGNIHIYDLR